MMGYLASRGLGIVRQSIFNGLFGTGSAANAYVAAARLPDTLFNLIAGGALSHAFIPIFVSYDKEHGQREAWRLASLVFNVLLVLLTLFVLIGEWFAPAFVNQLLVPGLSQQDRDLTTTLTRIMLFQPLILGLGTVVTAILNSKRQFLLPALSLAVFNLGLIGGLLFSIAIPGVGIYGPTFGMLAAAALQVGVELPGLLKQGVRYSFIWNLRHPGLREVMRLLVPNALAVGIASAAVIVDTNFASYLPDQASISALHSAQMLIALPVALISQAVGRALLTPMAMEAMAGRYVRLRQTILKVIGGSVLLSIPCAVGLYLFGKPLIHLLFQHGAFTRHSTELTNLVLIGYALSLPGQVASDLLIGSFYALKDARTPLFTNIFAFAVRYGLILLLLQALAGSSHIILALPAAYAIATTAEAALLVLILFFRLRRKVKTDRGMQRLLQRRRYIHNKQQRVQSEEMPS